ncbi:phosphotransferase family protein [Dietzia psychralcaliphila]|uniref:phosphotransferase family protein n=1 Tax=Dietzia psychralcaliphila TaxID=139021 RepID=UPI001C1DCFA0|nr:phosphotransferase family protein [Dietzia psychralcaliphila]
MESDTLARKVEALVALRDPGSRAEALDLRLLAGGMSRSTWAMTVRMDDDEGSSSDVDLVLQLLPESGLLEGDLVAEFELLRALAGTSVSAPRPFWLDPDGSVLGAPGLITGRVEGTCDPFILSTDEPLDTRLGLARNFIELLASLTTVDVSDLVRARRLEDPGLDAARLAVETWSARHEAVRTESSPELALIRSWLDSHAPTTPRRVLVHGDFKPGNILVRDGEVAALLDWETAHLGSPLEDLGWVTNPVRRGEHQIADHWEATDMIREFEKRSGIEVDPAQLRWWNVFSCYKLAVIVLSGVHGYLTGGSAHLHHQPTWLYRAMFKMIREAS